MIATRSLPMGRPGMFVELRADRAPRVENAPTDAMYTSQPGHRISFYNYFRHMRAHSGAHACALHVNPSVARAPRGRLVYGGFR
jgi:hypothetical protein